MNDLSFRCLGMPMRFVVDGVWLAHKGSCVLCVCAV